MGKPLETPLRMPLRLWMVVEVFFGVAAISTIFLRPHDTPTNFAWPIRPDVMAATLGAFYLASALIFVLPLFAKSWEEVRVMILPTAAFSTVMLGATVLHWNLFSVGTFPFYVWFASYVLPPPILVALYLWHQRGAAPVGTNVARPLAAWVRALFRVNGSAVVGIAVLGYAAPSTAISVAPWRFTPLTTRTFCGWLVAVGLLQVGMAWEGDWRRARLATTMLIVLLVALVFQLVRFDAQVEWSNAALWVVLTDATAVAVVSAYLWLRPPNVTSGLRDTEAGTSRV